ncbi:MAG: hypothetical protein JO261_12540 [Alphaproteobacteria bacterium]|nr:hypothetical protein [Alphaproteobacteria bacterium]MBV9694518.1 hypothetical protein [Alphaproteobacteria bacterium]
MRFPGWAGVLLLSAAPAIAAPQYLECNQTDAAPNEQPSVRYLRIEIVSAGYSTVDFAVDKSDTAKWKGFLGPAEDPSLKITDDAIDWNPIAHFHLDRRTNILTGGVFVPKTYQCKPYVLE